MCKYEIRYVGTSRENFVTSSWNCARYPSQYWTGRRDEGPIGCRYFHFAGLAAGSRKCFSPITDEPIRKLPDNSFLVGLFQFQYQFELLRACTCSKRTESLASNT